MSAHQRGMPHAVNRLPPSAPPGNPELPRRVLRAVTRGLITPRAVAAMDHERALVAAIRARRQHPELVVVLGVKGGVGTTSTAVGIGLTLAALRADETRLIDARCGTGSLGLRLAGHPAPTAADLLASHEAGQPAMPHSVRGLQIVDGARWHQPAARDHLARLLLIGASTATTLLDIGNDMGDIAHFALGRANRIVVVTTAGHDALQATRAAFDCVYQVNPALVERAVVAVVCLPHRRCRGVERTLRSQLNVAAAQVVPVPHDPALAADGVFNVDSLRPATREAYVHVAARISLPRH